MQLLCNVNSTKPIWRIRNFLVTYTLCTGENTYLNLVNFDIHGCLLKLFLTWFENISDMHINILQTHLPKVEFFTNSLESDQFQTLIIPEITSIIARLQAGPFKSMKIASDYNNIEYLLQKLSRYWTNNGICILLPSNHSLFSTWWTILRLTLQPPGSSPYSKHIRHYTIDTTTTTSSKRTKIAYFPVNLILKETLMVWADRRALVWKIGI